MRYWRRTGAEQVVASALHGWVLAVLAYDQVSDEAKMSLEQTTCTPAMQAACECVCDLYGLHAVDEDLRGVLQMASRFATPSSSSATVKSQS